MSRRRLEFLKALSDMVDETGGPVHYAGVAERVRVSRWTAYDIMRRLVSEGLVASSYSTASSGFRGRSQVLFEPTEAGRAALSGEGQSKPSAGEEPAEDWRRIARFLISRVRACPDDATAVLDGITDMSPMAYCASLLAALVIEFKRREMDMAVLQGLLFAGADPSYMLPLATGLLVGSLVVQGALRSIPGLEALARRFSEEIARMESRHQDLLLDFAKAIVGRPASE